MIDATRAVSNINRQTIADKEQGKRNDDNAYKVNTDGILFNMEIHEEDLKLAVESVNKDFKMDNSRLEYSYHDETNTYIVKIIDDITDEIIKQIPSQKLLDIAAGLVEYLGINVDDIV